MSNNIDNIEERIACGPRSELFGEEERLQRVKNRMQNPEAIAAKQREMKLLKRRIQRRGREQALRDLGLVKVRGAVSGKIYWE